MALVCILLSGFRLLIQRLSTSRYYFVRCTQCCIKLNFFHIILCRVLNWLIHDCPLFSLFGFFFFFFLMTFLHTQTMCYIILLSWNSSSPTLGLARVVSDCCTWNLGARGRRSIWLVFSTRLQPPHSTCMDIKCIDPPKCIPAGFMVWPDGENTKRDSQTQEMLTKGWLKALKNEKGDENERVNS